MSVLPIDADGHDRVQSLLPWYASGRLPSAEHAEVDAHLAVCPRCRAELDFDQALRCISPDEAGDADRGWAALRAHLAPTARPKRRALPWPWLFGAQFALSAVLAVLLLLRPSAPEPAYRALGPAASAAPNALVMFHPDATEIQLRSALNATGATLVGGPTSTQAYLVRLPRADADALIALRKQPGVSMAESLDAK